MHLRWWSPDFWTINSMRVICFFWHQKRKPNMINKRLEITHWVCFQFTLFSMYFPQTNRSFDSLSDYSSWEHFGGSPAPILLMEEILHQLIWRIYHYLNMVLYISGGDRRISEPSTVWICSTQNMGYPAYTQGKKDRSAEEASTLN